MSDRWMSIVEYSRAFNISDMTVRRRIKTGRLHAVLKDGKYFIPVAGNEENSCLQQMTPQQNATKQAPADWNMMKGHPQPQATFQAQTPQSQMQSIPSQVLENDMSFSLEPSGKQTVNQVSRQHIPNTLENIYTNAEKASVSGVALLDLCDKTIGELRAAEKRLESQYKDKFARLEGQLKSKEDEIKSLYQQVEDLQLLVNMIDKNGN